MKRVVLICIIAILSFFCVSPQKVFAEQSHIVEIQNYENAIYLSHFNEVKNRTAGGDGEHFMADLLCGILQDNGFEYLENNISYKQTFELSKNVSSSNVIGVKNNNAEKYIVIGAHYDSVYVENKSYGYIDNLSGVLAVILTADLLKSFSNVNFIFAFWGAEENAMKGSQYFLEHISSELKNNIALYINYDTIGAGDNYYYQTVSGNTAYGNYIDNYFKNVDIEKYSAPLVNALVSDNNAFIDKRINSLSFFTGNVGSFSNYVETTSHSAIIHNEDSKEVVDSVFSEDSFYENIDFFVNQVYNFVNTTNFNSVEFESNQIPLVKPLTVVVIIFVLMIIISIIVIKIQTKNNKTDRFKKIKNY